VKAINIVGYFLVLGGCFWLAVSIISTSEYLGLTFLGVVLVVIGIGLLSLSKNLDKRQKASCNCCKCSNCKLDHDHWSH